MSSFRNKPRNESHLGRLLRGWNHTEDEFGLRLEELEDRIFLSASPLPVLVEQTAVLDTGDSPGGTTGSADSTVESTSSTQSSQSSQIDDTATTDLAQETTFELVFIDDSVADKQTLLDDLNREIAGREIVVIELDFTQDGVDQITTALQQYQNVDAVHIVTHGDDGAVQLGNTWLDLTSLDQHAPAMLTWGAALESDADILFFGCDLAETESGQSLIEAISLLTGTDVAASTDDTGAAIFGGDWDLEFEFGEITTGSAFSTTAQGRWQGLLTTVSFQNDINGYVSTVDTFLSDGTSDDNSNTDLLLANASDPSQTLIRFDDLFGMGPNAIPPGATIDSVTITLQVIKNDAGPVNVSLHRMLQSWDELSTWDSMILGISTDDVEAQSSADAIILGQATESTITLTGPGLVETVQAWANGETNYGWTLVTNSPGRWEIASSENADVSLRPKLTVTYTPNTPPVGQNDTYTTNEEEPLVAYSDWFDSNWSHRTQLSFNNLDRTESFSDFPVLIELDATRIDYSKVQSNGEDLRFVDHDGTVLSYEIESWDPNGTSYVWVKIPMVDAATDSDFIWMYYGNDTAASGENAADVWSSSYQTVYHLDGDIADGGTVADSSGNFDGTNNGTTKTEGVIGDGQAFDAAAAQYIDIGSDLDLLRNAESATISLWVNPTTNQSSTIVAVSTNSLTLQPRATLNATGEEYRLDGKSQDSLFTSTQSAETSNTPFIANTWQHVVGVIDYAEDRIDIYVDGVLVETRAVSFSTTTTPDTNSSSAKIGTDESALFGYFDGLIDEVRIAETERSAEWIEAQYASMTGSFVNYGTTQEGTTNVLLNDVDPNNQTLTTTLVSGPSHSSSFSLNSDGSFNYTPVDDFYGTDTFTYEVSDGFATSTATVTINVVNVNDAPVWAANKLTISEDGTVLITSSEIAVTDVDNTDAELIFTVTSATHGHFANAADLNTALTSFSQQDIVNGDIYFVHDQSESAPAYTLDVSDGALSAGPLIGSISYFAINDAPTIAFPPTASTFKNQSITFSSTNGNAISIGDVDAAGLPVQVTLNVGNGTISLGSSSGVTIVSDDGTNVVLEGTIADLNAAFDGLVWSPTTGVSGATSLAITVDDLGNTGAASESATATINITVINQLPIASTGGPYYISEGESVLLDATGSSDPDGDGLTYLWDLNNDGFWDVSGVNPTVTWSTLNFYGIFDDGSYTIRLRVSDGDGGVTIATTTLHVANTPPTANNDGGAGFTTNEGTAFLTGNVLANDPDPGFDALYVESFDTSGMLGELTYFGFGSFYYDPKGNFDYLAASETATEQFTYIVNDGDGGTSQATVTITIEGVNNPPTLLNNNLALNEGDAVTLTIANLSGDDVDGTNADLVFHVSNVNHGFFELTSAPGSAVTSFTQSQVASSEVVFVHDGSDNPPSYDVSVSDGLASTTPVAASITFNPVNDAPTISPIPNQTINEDEVSAPISFTIGDSETAPDSLVVSASSDDQTLLADSTIVISGTGANRSLTLEAKPNQSGGPVTITVSVSDGSTTTQTTFDVTILPVNDPPQITTNALAISEGGTVTLSGSNLTSTDADSPNGSLQYTVSNVQNGFFALTASPTMPITSFAQNDVNTGKVVFVHDGSEFAPSYEVTVSDGDISTGPLAASIDFTSLNDAPTISSIADQIINEDEISAPISFTIGDEESLADSLTISVSSSNQSLLPDGNIVLSGTGANRTLTLLSANNQSGGPVTITLTVSDGSKSTQTFFNVTITPTNDPPLLGNNSLNVIEGGTVTLTSSNLSATDIDNTNSDLQFTVINVQNGHFALAVTPAISITAFNQSQVTSGQIVFVHDGGETAPAYDVTVSDGTAITGPVAAMVTFTNQNDAPTISSIGPQTIGEDVTSAPIAFAINDSETLADSLVVTASSNNQTLLPDGNIVLSGTGENRFLTLLSAPNRSGGPVTVTVSVSDGSVTTQTTFAVIIQPVNDPPQLVNNQLTLLEGDTVTLTTANLRATDVDATVSSIIFSVTNVQQGYFALSTTPTVANAITTFTQTQVANGEVVFVHDGSNIAPAYDVTVSDGLLSDGPYAATILFNNVNDAPTISGIANQTILEDQISSPIDFVIGDSESPVNSLAVTATSNDQSLIPDGNISLSGTGPNRSLTLLSATNQFGGTVTITISVSDGIATTQTQFYVTIQPQNDAPVIVSNNLTVNEGGTVTLTNSNLSSTDIETSNSALQYTTSNVLHGFFALTTLPTASINTFTQAQINNGDIVFVHDGGELAPSYDISVSDGTTSTGPNTAVITFSNVNDLPTISAIGPQTINEDETSVPISFTIGDSESPLSGLTVTAVSNNQTLLPNSNIVLVGTGATRTLTLLSAPNQSGGPITITVSVTDGTATSQTTFLVTILPTNDPPQILANNLTIEGGRTVAVTSANLSTSDIDSADSLLTYSITNLQNGYFALASTPNVAITSFTQYQVDNGQIVFVHDGSETAPAYDVTVSDGAVSDGPVAATITFTNKNDAPTISTIADQTLIEDTPSGSIAFTVGDMDNPATGLTVTAASSDPSLIPLGNIVITGADANRALTITPASNQFGGPVTITLTVSDGTATSQTTFDVTVDPVNDPPVLGNHQLTIIEGGRVTISSSNISGTDLESSPQSLTFHVSNVTHGYFENSASPGTAITSFTGTQIQNGEVVFVHDGGELAPNFDIRVSDGVDSSAPTAATITFTNQNDAPTISSIANQVIDEDVLSSPIAFTVGDAETTADSLIITVQSSNQSLLPDGNITFTGTGSSRSLTLQSSPNQFGGPVVVTVAVSDGVRSSQTTFEVTIQPVNDPPTLVNNNLAIDEGQTVRLTTSNLSANDIDSSTLEYSVSNVQHGYFALSSASTTVITRFTYAQLANGEVIFVHDGSEFAPSYDTSVSDGSASTAPQASTITFTNTNDPPTISAIGNQSLVEDTTSSPIAFVVGDIDNTAGSLVVTATSDNQLILPDGNIVLGGTGANRTITLTPATNQFGGPLTVTVTVSDGVTSTQTTFQVTVQPVNDPPVLNYAQLTISEGEQVTLSSSHLSGSDIETNTDDLIYEVSNVVHGHFAQEGDWSTPISSFNGAQLRYGEIVFIHDGGELAPAFDVRVSDGSLWSSMQSAYVVFTNTNDAPTISSIADQIILEDHSTGPLSFTLADVDSSLGSLSVTATSSNPAIIPNGNLVISGSGANWTIDVTPAASANGGPVTITLVASDGDHSSQTTFDVTITAVNDPPEIVSTSFSVNENAAAASLGLVQVIDPDSSDFTFNIAGGTGAGRFAIDATTGKITTVGSLDFETRSNYTLDVEVTDETGLTDFKSVQILVNNVNEAPTGGNDYYFVDPGEDLIVGGLGVLLNDIDVDSAVLTVILESDASHGTVTLNSSGGFTYIGDGTSTPIDQFTYRLTDGEFVTAPITVTIQLNAGGTTSSGSDGDNTNTNTNNDPDTNPTDDGNNDTDSTTTNSEDSTPPPVNNNTSPGDSSSEDEDTAMPPIVLPPSIVEVFDFVNQVLDIDPTVEERSSQSETLSTALEIAEQIAPGLQSLLTNWRTSTDIETVNRICSTLNSQSLWKEWEQVEEVIKSETSVAKLTHHSAAITVSGSLTVGYVLWTLRGGVLLTSLLAQMPAWKLMDPLVVLEHLEDVSNEDDDSLESLVDRDDDDILDEGEAEDV